jgi:predicted outer membrane lipoprotein
LLVWILGVALLCAWSVLVLVFWPFLVVLVVY